MSPEVWDIAKCSHKSDIWSLGCVVYELMSHKTPFSAKEIPMAVFFKEPAPLPSHYNREMCNVVIEKMLKKDPVQRISAQELMKVTFSF